MTPAVTVIRSGVPELVEAGLRSDLSFRAEAEKLSREAESALNYELSSTRLFRVVKADSMAALIRQKDPAYARFPRVPWGQYLSSIDADGIIDVRLSFKSQGGGINTYAVLSLFDRRGSELVTVKFNTQWGKSYLLPEDGWTTMPDAIHGAVVGLAKAFRKQTAAGGAPGHLAGSGC